MSEAEARIVVGVDGSAPSKEALRWAVRQAQLVHGTVDAVIAWDYATTYYGWVSEAGFGDFDDQLGEQLAKAMDETVGSDPPVEIRTHVLRGDPSTVLLEMADGATLLVVGSRGHGAFVGALMGSVSDRCVHHATCPVVVVRPTDEHGDG